MACSSFFFLLHRGIFWNGKYGAGKFYGKRLKKCISDSCVFYSDCISSSGCVCFEWRNETDCSLYRKISSSDGRNLSDNSMWNFDCLSAKSWMGIFGNYKKCIYSESSVCRGWRIPVKNSHSNRNFKRGIFQ